MIGRKRSRQASKIASRGSMPCVRSASSAKSIIMMAFFLTMPISRITPISAMMAELRAEQQQRQHRADAGRRQGGQDGDRVDVALVEHAQHDVDGDQRGDDQHRLAVQRLLEGLRGALEAAVDRWPACRSARIARSIAAVASPSDLPGARLNEIVRGDEQPLVVHRQRRVAWAEVA